MRSLRSMPLSTVISRFSASIRTVRLSNRVLMMVPSQPLGEAVRVPRGDLHLALGRHELLLAARVGDAGRAADAAVREGAVCVADGAVGGAVDAGYRITRRAGAGEAYLGKDEEHKDLQSFHYC